MIRVTDITIARPSMPAALQTLEATIDAQLSQEWGVNETARTFTLTWANVGGWTQAKENAAGKLLELYDHEGGWVVDWGSDATTASATFRRR